MSKYYNIEYLYALIYDCINLFESNRYFSKYEEIDINKWDIGINMMKKLNINTDNIYYRNEDDYNIINYKDEYIKKFGEKEYLQIEKEYSKLTEEKNKYIEHDKKYHIYTDNNEYIKNITEYFNNEFKLININCIDINNIIDKDLIINFKELFKNFDNNKYLLFLKNCNCFINEWNLDYESFDIEYIHNFKLHETEWWIFIEDNNEIESFEININCHIINCFYYHLLIDFLNNKNINIYPNYYLDDKDYELLNMNYVFINNINYKKLNVKKYKRISCIDKYKIKYYIDEDYNNLEILFNNDNLNLNKIILKEIKTDMLKPYVFYIDTFIKHLNLFRQRIDYNFLDFIKIITNKHVYKKDSDLLNANNEEKQKMKEINSLYYDNYYNQYKEIIINNLNKSNLLNKLKNMNLDNNKLIKDKNITNFIMYYITYIIFRKSKLLIKYDMYLDLNKLSFNDFIEKYNNIISKYFKYEINVNNIIQNIDIELIEEININNITYKKYGKNYYILKKSLIYLNYFHFIEKFISFYNYIINLNNNIKNNIYEDFLMNEIDHCFY